MVVKKLNVSLDAVPGEIPEKKKKIKIVIKPIEPAKKVVKPKTPVKEKKKLEELVKKEAQKSIAPEVIPEKTPDIEYIIKETTKYDVNWFRIKRTFVRFEKWLISPYVRYANWWNRVVNKKNPIKNNWIETDNLKDLYEDIPPKVLDNGVPGAPQLTAKIHKKQIEKLSENEISDLIKIKKAMDLIEDQKNGIIRSDK